MEGLEVALDLRFGPEGLAMLPDIRKQTDTALLRRLLETARRRDSTPADIRGLLATDTKK